MTRKYENGVRVKLSDGTTGKIQSWLGPHHPAFYRVELDEESEAYGNSRNAHEKEISVVGLYYLRNVGAGCVGNTVLWWRNGGSGYTTRVNEAQRFSMEEAQKIVQGSSGTHDWEIWPLDDVIRASQLTVDHQDLR